MEIYGNLTCDPKIDGVEEAVDPLATFGRVDPFMFLLLRKMFCVKEKLSSVADIMYYDWFVMLDVCFLLSSYC